MVVAMATCGGPTGVGAAEPTAEKLYFEGLAALRGDRLHEALGLFDRALAAGGSAELRASVLRAYGHAAGRVVEADRALACRSAGYYREWLGSAPAEDDKRPDVIAAMGEMRRLCDAEAAAVASGVAGDRTVEAWVLTGGAAAALVGGVVGTAVMLSLQSDYEKDADAIAETREPARQAALVDRLAETDGQIEQAEALSVGFYVAAGLLAAGAAWVWWSSDAPASEVAVGIGPGMIGVGGRW